VYPTYDDVRMSGCYIKLLLLLLLWLLGILLVFLKLAPINSGLSVWEPLTITHAPCLHIFAIIKPLMFNFV
jgi:hypothetical protein